MDDMIINLRDIVVVGVPVAVVIAYQIERVLKPILDALYAIGAVVLFGRSVDQSAAEQVQKERQLADALWALYKLIPYYVLLGASAWVAAQARFAWFPVLGPTMSPIFSALTIATGAGGIYDLVKQIYEWVDMFTEVMANRGS